MIKKERLNLIKKYLITIPLTLGGHVLPDSTREKSLCEAIFLNKTGKYMLKFGLIIVYYLFGGRKFG